MTEISPRSGVIWISGYSGAGKTTVAREVEGLLRRRGDKVILLDGDDLRSIFAGRWGYEKSERIELAHVYFRLCSHLASQGFVVVIAAVAMYDDVRSWVRVNVPFSWEVYLDVPRSVRLSRDAGTKMIYTSGTDLEDIYDPPTDPDLRIENFGETSPAEAAGTIVETFLTLDVLKEPDRGRAHHWDAYYGDRVGVEGPSPFAVEAERQLPRHSAVLEVGCGNGRDAAYLSERGHDVVGIDTSSAAIALCQQVHSARPAKFYTGQVSDFGDEWERSFDVLYSRFVLHAMTQSEELALWQQARDILRPGGLVLVECRSINDPLARQGEVLSPTERIAGHYRRFIVLGDLRRRLEERGFVVDSFTESDGLAVHGDENPVVIRMVAHNGRQ